MQEKKKSVIFYADTLHTFEELTDTQAGRLIKHFLRYINDLNPVAPDKITKIAFEPLKQQLKRDLNKWDKIREKRAEAGRISAERKKQNSTNSTNVEQDQQTATKSTVSDSESVSVNGSVSDSVSVTSKRKKTRESVPNFEEVLEYFTKSGYTAEAAGKFFNYYADGEWHDSKGNRVRNWKQKAQAVWFKDENKIVQKAIKTPQLQNNEW